MAGSLRSGSCGLAHASWLGRGILIREPIRLLCQVQLHELTPASHPIPGLHCRRVLPGTMPVQRPWRACSGCCSFSRTHPRTTPDSARGSHAPNQTLAGQGHSPGHPLTPQFISAPSWSPKPTPEPVPPNPCYHKPGHPWVRVPWKQSGTKSALRRWPPRAPHAC